MKKYLSPEAKLLMAYSSIERIPAKKFDPNRFFKSDEEGNHNKNLNIFLDVVEIYWHDKFISPFILDTVVNGEDWAGDMGDNPKDRLVNMIKQIEQYMVNNQKAA